MNKTIRKYQENYLIFNQRAVIAEFRGAYAFLSNFFSAPITYGGFRFASNEAAFQAQKTTSQKERQRFTRLTDPADAKALGRKMCLRSDWNKIKIRCMYEICMTKFIQHPELLHELEATGNAVLIEGNCWGDRFWGMVNGSGENHLGLILMDIREKLRNEY